MRRVENKIAFITGAARGIGVETARLLASEGAKVIVTDVLREEGEELAKSIGGEYFYLDVADDDNWQSVAAKVQKSYESIDIMFNNAGITGLNEDLGQQDPENITLDAWHAVHKINLDGVFLGCKYAILLMKKNGGSIINMSSRSGVVGVPGASAYASSKAAIRNHTKSVALYCAEKSYRIRCNSVHPGAILTPIWDPMLGVGGDREKMLANISAGIPLGNMGEPLDVAYAVLYLGSEESKYVTGIELTIDGGILAGSSSSPKAK